MLTIFEAFFLLYDNLCEKKRQEKLSNMRHNQIPKKDDLTLEDLDMKIWGVYVKYCLRRDLCGYLLPCDMKIGSRTNYPFECPNCHKICKVRLCDLKKQKGVCEKSCPNSLEESCAAPGFIDKKYTVVGIVDKDGKEHRNGRKMLNTIGKNTGRHTKVRLILQCDKKHKEYRVRPDLYNNRRRCPYCKNKTERIIAAILTYFGIRFKRGHVVKINDKWREYDFYLPDYNVVIELDGVQHFKYVHLYHKGKRTLKKGREHDQQKMEYCKDGKFEFEGEEPQHGCTMVRLEQEHVYNASFPWQYWLKTTLEKHCGKNKPPRIITTRTENYTKNFGLEEFCESVGLPQPIFLSVNTPVLIQKFFYMSCMEEFYKKIKKDKKLIEQQFPDMLLGKNKNNRKRKLELIK